MDSNGYFGTKDISTLQSETIQSRIRDGENNGVSVLNFLVRGGELVSPWWSRQRDIDLAQFAMQSDHLESAIYKASTKMAAILPKIEPRDTTIKAHMRQAEEFNRILIEDSDFGNGWSELVGKAYNDLFTQDNGMFWEVIGEGKKDGPIRGPALGLASLDAQQCTRTGNAEYPVVYADTDGSKYKLHYSRVIFRAQHPSPRASMNGVGRCWASRCINDTQNLIDIGIYKQEKLGSRPLRQMLIGKGISAMQIWEAIVMAEEGMDNSNLRRYAKNVVIGAQNNTEIDVDVKDLASVPDGFDERDATELAMFAIALAGGFPPRDLWPATTTGATRADAMFQHLVGSSGYKAILDSVAFALGGSPEGSRHQVGKFLPPHLKITFDLVDDEQDKQIAEIRDIRAGMRGKRLAAGEINMRVARESALSNGDLTQPQFEALELEDGRLPDGNDVLMLFYSPDPMTQELLRLSVGDPLNIDANTAQSEFVIAQITEAIASANVELMTNPRVSGQKIIKQAIAALEKLKGLYQGEMIGAEAESEGEPPTADDEEMPEDEESAADDSEGIDDDQPTD